MDVPHGKSNQKPAGRTGLPIWIGNPAVFGMEKRKIKWYARSRKI